MKKFSEIIKSKINAILLLSLAILLLSNFKAFAQSGEATIYLDSTQQIIRGFGAANIVGWRPDMTADQINTAFGTGNGQLGFSILRFRIPPQQNSFSINLPSAVAAYSMGVTLIASPWSPPASMKSNNSTIAGVLNESSYADFAAYLKSFADYMSTNGAPIYAISVQNEPDVSVTYESCDYNPSQMLKFVKENASSIGTKVIAPESFHFATDYSDSLLNDSAALSNFDILGGHIYGGGLEPNPLAKSKGKEIWMTEHLDTDTSWAHVLATGKEINDCMSDGMSAYVWWYIIRFYGPIDENGVVTKRGYIMSQYSKFIRPGFNKVWATENPQTGVYLTAYSNGIKLVIVAVNEGNVSTDQAFNIPNGTFTKFTSYVTSQTKNFIQGSDITVSNDKLTATLDKSSVTTFVSNEGTLPVELISFNANVDKNKIKLSWSTASENNNAGFEILRSTDLKNFIKIGYVEGNGTSTERTDYSFIDDFTAANIYYKFKQIDFDGSFSYSKIVEVTTTPLTFNLAQNYPNPFNPTTKINYSIPIDGYVTLKLYDVLGKEVATIFNGYQSEGSHSLVFNADGLAAGIYFYTLNATNKIKTKKLILLK